MCLRAERPSTLDRQMANDECMDGERSRRKGLKVMGLALSRQPAGKEAKRKRKFKLLDVDG